MRKDVRLGTAIGGVIIAAIVAYAIIPKGHTNNKKDPIAVDTGKAGSFAGNDRPGAGDAMTGAHEEHPDPSTILTHDPSTGGSPTPAPARLDGAAAPAPVPSADAETAMTEHRRNWITSLSAADSTPGIRETAQPDHVAGADSPSAPTPDNTPGAVIPAVDHQQGDGPTPTGDAIPISSRATNSDAHPRTFIPAGSTRTHRIASGETFSSIARATYGDAKYYKEIIAANPKVDPNHLKPGMTIVLPDKPAARHDAAPAAPADSTSSPETRHRASVAPATINPATEYRVRSSDSLYKISLKLYHSPNKVDAIYQLNKEQIGVDPAKLKLGMVLKLPEAPTEASAK